MSKATPPAVVYPAPPHVLAHWKFPDGPSFNTVSLNGQSLKVLF
jgi:hypothetical protein